MIHTNVRLDVEDVLQHLIGKRKCSRYRIKKDRLIRQRIIRMMRPGSVRKIPLNWISAQQIFRKQFGVGINLNFVLQIKQHSFGLPVPIFSQVHGPDLTFPCIAWNVLINSGNMMPQIIRSGYAWAECGSHY